MNLDMHIEAVLFYKTEPVLHTDLAAFLGVSQDTLESGLVALAERLSAGATRLIDTGTEVHLVSAPEVAETIEKLRKDELSRDIGKAGAETLAIILYRGSVSRAQIDFIRGVNSSFILRNLQIRGLVDRMTHPKRANTFQYAATPALYAHLGITRKEELPEYISVMDEIDRYEKEAHGDEATPENVSAEELTPTMTSN